MQQNKEIIIPAWVIHLVTRDGYMDRFYHHRHDGLNCRDAYEKVEEELHVYFKAHRYTSYESFLTSKTNYIKKKLGK